MFLDEELFANAHARKVALPENVLTSDIKTEIIQAGGLLLAKQQRGMADSSQNRERRS
jgi:hypothetical protein